MVGERESACDEVLASSHQRDGGVAAHEGSTIGVGRRLGVVLRVRCQERPASYRVELHLSTGPTRGAAGGCGSWSGSRCRIHHGRGRRRGSRICRGHRVGGRGRVSRSGLRNGSLGGCYSSGCDADAATEEGLLLHSSLLGRGGILESDDPAHEGEGRDQTDQRARAACRVQLSHRPRTRVRCRRPRCGWGSGSARERQPGR